MTVAAFAAAGGACAMAKRWSALLVLFIYLSAACAAYPTLERDLPGIACIDGRKFCPGSPPITSRRFMTRRLS